MDAPSFQELPLGWRRDLTALHNDYFYERQEQLWTRKALQTLPALMQATDMLVCGEDLGMLAPCVHPVMAQLGLVGEAGQPVDKLGSDRGCQEQEMEQCINNLRASPFHLTSGHCPAAAVCGSGQGVQQS